MITPQGTVKVMDFGIARAVSDSAATMTSTAAVIGTAQYLSPEQARGEGVDARSDVYSVGCLLYELVTGTPPFTGDSPVAVAYQHVREDPRLPSSINHEVPPELDAILLKAMSKNPANRYQSAADMRNDLLRALAGQRVEATPVMGENEKTTLLAAAPAGYGYGRDDDDWDDEEDEAARRKRRNRIIALVTVLAVLLVGGAITAFVLLNGKDDNTPPAATQVTVPNVVNVAEADARAQITAAQLTVGTVTPQPSTAAQKGLVLSTNPAGGAKADKGAKVDLAVGAGPNTQAIPAVIGLDVSDAKDNLTGAGFTGNINTEQVDSLKPEGTVVDVDPKQGTQAALDAAITLSVSDGDVPIPAVVGQQQAAAQQALKDAGFTNVTVKQVEDASQPAGTVTAVDPGQNTQASADTAITLSVASAPTKATIPPSIVGKDEATARQILTQAGFTNITSLQTEAPNGQDPGTVVGSDPQPGTQAGKGDQITLLVVGPA
jgi:serine/threonine-protein kinase